jgi:hypothetical protein
VVVAGSNDYCAQIVNGDVWAGYYRSTDGGQTWANSLVPGYPADGSPAGMASPAHGVCGAAGDPTQAFDTGGRLFYGFICFNRAKPVNGGIYVATYGSDGATYLRTVEVAKGSPSAQFNGSGAFQDKGNVVVDQGSSPYAGTVYVTWSRYAGKAANNAVFFSRSGDHGQSFSSPIHIDAGSGSASFADAAVGPDGAVYVTYRTYAIQGQTADAFWIVKSSDGGRTFGVPRLVASITPFSSDQFTGGTGGVDCGDGPFACPSGFTFSRFDSLSAVAADATGVHVVYAARSSSGQGKVYVRNSRDGVNWATPATTLDAVPTGHQWTPDIASADGPAGRRVLRLARRPGIRAERAPRQHRGRRELRRRDQHLPRAIDRRRGDVERDPAEHARQQLRLGDSRGTPRRVLGRLRLRVGSARRRDFGVDGLARSRVRRGPARAHCH